MRLLLCNWKDLAHPRAGGAEVWTRGVTSAWAADGHDVTIACSMAPGLARVEWHDGVEIVRGGDYRFGVRAHARHLYEQRHGKFDVVVDEINTRPFLAPRWADRSHVVAFVHQVAREVWFRETPLPVAVVGRYVLEPRWLRAYRRTPVLSASRSTVESLRDYGIEHAVALHQGTDPLTRPRVSKESEPTFVFVGRLCSMKRPMDAIRAVRSVQREVPSTRLWIIGAGPEERALRRHCGDGITLLGAVDAAGRNDAMARAHALVCTSVREGWGLVVSEAAALGTTTVGYAVPGLVDSIGASGGTLVAPYVDALAAALLPIARDPAGAAEPAGTGTVPFATVAREFLETAEVSARA
jgi:glycosyltransferase involved in cell wall biosynthesis